LEKVFHVVGAKENRMRDSQRGGGKRPRKKVKGISHTTEEKKHFSICAEA
jgi:hypothetical protein